MVESGDCGSPVCAVVLLLSHARLFGIPQTAARQASLFLTISRSLPKFVSIESVMPSNHLILCHPPLLLPSIFPSIRVLKLRQFMLNFVCELTRINSALGELS